MASDQDRLHYLLARYTRREISREELEELLAYFGDEAYREVIHAFMDVHAQQQDRAVEETTVDWEAMYERILKRQRVKVRPLWQRLTAAASVLLLLSAGGYLLWHRPVKESGQQAAVIRPGGNKAVLSTHGKRIVLNAIGKGLILNEKNVAIDKTADGEVAYRGGRATSGAESSETVYDTLTVPRGGQHQLVLADGSKVWLNADSRLRFPENFTGGQRVVDLLYGEAYFEVRHDAAVPFRVKVKGEIIEDLGTHFNINAYDDEPTIRTTLVEGSVRLFANQQDVLLKPGQQAVSDGAGHDIRVRNADVGEVIAWKNGMFDFNQTRLFELMRTLSRWYDIRVAYEGNVKDESCFVKIRRDADLAQVLKVLALGGVHYRLEGRKLIVFP